MTELNLLSKKLELIQWLSNLENPGVIARLLALRDSVQSDWWESLSDKEKGSILKGLEDSEAGKLIDHEVVRKTYERWL